MSDTGEQGTEPQDPADRAGVGGGIVPDDQNEGSAQEEAAAAQSEDSTDEPEAGHPGRD
jgi:hypothetical protein